ncbi:D-alanyl-D-alanine carboxypeptidase/D-alanyl-D-alanine-endopeptidase (penicillin-binding protein 4) [Psychrobacter luti]|uniref:D-alanyl-D-alanine carboxypeptidase/D-alanyl-D-alanine-endopeptidase (Penicillin-binding protein 4) n=1 Tax=Psychrobacter luti TaxID=198481 RepID=A0A839THP7_9GAMM|nr:D-alanyl-D-alanine carboxypeptidase [Psychrobacter luti]MBB3107916.1 D-alanyl-D-alanine carboxypeptidase/D-alanyl-D-alanine-endopeptidase (penicillin-binding protein 4) [Psychrobacter luti]
MLPTSKTNNRPITTAELIPVSQPLYSLNQPAKYLATLSTLALFASAMLTPLYAQAALPEAIQTALTRANLSATDISIVITPVGDKNASRLPAPIQVINSPKQGINSSHIDSQPKSLSADNVAAEPSSMQKQALKNNNAKEVSVHQSPLVTIEKQTIKQHEKQLHAYTDDPYTYQSLESSPSLLPDDSQSVPSAPNQNSKNNGSNVTTNTIKISFSPLLSHQADIARTPASTMKLVPSFIALDTLGADFVWHTRVYHTGIIIGDKLYGDLIIQGSGDPKMTHERLQQLLYKVQTAGIRHINGDIIVDSGVFKNVSKDPAAFDNSPLRPYNASPDGFLVNFSSIGIQTYPLDNTRAQLTYTPQLADYQLPSMINTRSAACGQARYSLAPQWQSTKLTLNANLPDSCGEHAFYVAYPDAKDFAARVIASKWQTLGNTLTGKVISQETPYSINNTSDKQAKSPRGLAAIAISPLPIISYPSLNLTQQIYDINHFSNNVMTEQVALSIGAYDKASMNRNGINSTSLNKAGSDKLNTDKVAINKVDVNKKSADTNKIIHQQATSLYQFGQPTATDYSQALQTINTWWQTKLTTPPPHLTNGSGLCRDCTISAENLSELLTYAYEQPSFDAYVSSLGIAGVSGTISAHSERLPESQAIGRAWIKTGTLNNVTSMAGYVRGLSGQDYVVVGLINSDQALNAYTARPVLDAMLDWTAQH